MASPVESDSRLRELNAAVACLEEASRLLAASIMTEPLEVIEMYYAFVRRAKARTSGALKAFRDQINEESAGTT